MICPTCGAKTKVLETRGGETLMVSRVRFCPNNHLFNTMEQVGPKISPYGPSNTVGATTPPGGKPKPL